MLVLTNDNEMWVEYQEGVRFKIRAFDKELFRKLRREATVKRQIIERGQKRIIEELDEDLFDTLCYRAIIKDWEGIVDERGNPLPCNEKNIDLVMSKFPNVSQFILDEAMSLAETLSKKKEEELKNLKNLQAGSLKKASHAKNARS